jgi:endonuclease/exonuclease/phosphatase family metal-dependent hydrolase
MKGIRMSTVDKSHIEVFLTSGAFMRKIVLFIATSLLLVNVRADELDKPVGTDLRVASYNAYQSRIYKGNDNSSKGDRYDSWIRMVDALDADIWIFQEMFYNDSTVPSSYADDFTAHMRTITGDTSWAWASDLKGRFLLSRYPVMWSAEIRHRVHATWIDLPSSVSSRDLLVINVHFLNDTTGQAEDARDFIRQVRAGTHPAGIPSNISILVGGDFNAESESAAYARIADEGFADIKPAHTGTSGEYHSFGDVDFDNNSVVSIGKKRIDYLMSESDVLTAGNSFILNTLIMNSADLSATGLQRSDVSTNPESSYDFVNGRIACDHFPLIVDFSEGTSSGAENDLAVSFNTPSGNTSVDVGTDLTVKVDASDSDGIARVELYKDGVLIRSDDTAPYEWADAALQDLSAGLFVLKAVAVDGLGNERFALRTMTVGVQLDPEVSFNTPSGDTTLAVGDSLYVKVDASDGDEIERVYLYKDGTLIRGEGGAPYEWNAEGQDDPELRTLQAGSFVLKAVAKDTLGNESETSITVTVGSGGTSEPAVSFNTPSGDTTLDAGADLYVKVDASDMDGIAKVYLYKDDVLIRGEGGAPYEWNDPAQPNAKDVVLQNLQVGSFVLKAMARDLLGNENATSMTITIAALAYGYDIWAAEKGIGGETEDDDGDGRNNFYEYVLGGNPTSTVDAAAMDPIFEKDGSVLTYTHFKRSDDPDLSYYVEACSDLSSGGWTNAAVSLVQVNSVVGAYESVSHELSIDFPNSFIRLRVQRD